MNKVSQSTKRNSMGIGASLATVITWGITTFTGVPIPAEVAVAMSSIILMGISEITKD